MSDADVAETEVVEGDEEVVGEGEGEGEGEGGGKKKLSGKKLVLFIALPLILLLLGGGARCRRGDHQPDPFRRRPAI